jgi:hypothetical protein
MTVPIIIGTHPLFTEIVSMNIRYLLLVFTLMAVEANADSSTLDAAIGGGIGGAAGAAIGNEIGGRDGAIIGGALGGAVGAAVTTKDEPRHTSKHRKVNYESSQPRYEYDGYHYYPHTSMHRKTNYRRSHPRHEHHGSHFCPPGQAKKGRC